MLGVVYFTRSDLGVFVSFCLIRLAPVFFHFGKGAAYRRLCRYIILCAQVLIMKVLMVMKRLPA
jgi:hypothetical protein